MPRSNKHWRVVCLLMLISGAAQVALPASQISSGERRQLLQERAQRTQTARTLLHSERPALGLSADNTFEPASSVYDEMGRLHVRFHRFYKGVRVMGGDIKFAVDRSGAAGRVNTKPRQTIALPSVTPAISKDELNGILARDLRVPQADIAIETELVIYEGVNLVHLAWLASIRGNHIEPTRYLVDAHTGAVLRKWSGLATALVPKTNKGMPYLYDYFVDIDHQLDTGSNRVRLHDPVRQIKIYDMRDQAETLSWSGELFEQDFSPIEPVWGNGQDWVLGGDTYGPPGQTAAVEAYHGARLTFDMLQKVLGRDGLDDSNGSIRLRVHYRKDKNEHYGDANWDGTYANFGDGTTSEANSRTDVMTVAHELGHALWNYAVTYDNDGGERKGLNEGHGDILGAIVEHYRVLAEGAGSVVPTNDPGKVSRFLARSINPWGYITSGEVGMPYWVEGMGDMEEHIQGCAYGRMFATLAMGAPSVAEYENGPPCQVQDVAFRCLVSPYVSQGVAGIGMQKATKIWYLGTVGYFDGKPTFHEARDAYLNAAADLYGLNSPEYKSVMQAWAAIHVGDQAVDTQSPTVTIAGPLINNFEQTMVVGASGLDDIGVYRLEITRGSSIIQVIDAASWVGLVDLSTVSFGNHKVQAKVYDRAGKTGQAEKALPYKGASFLIKNRGFEQGSDGWEKSAGLIKSSSELAFLGSGFASFNGSHWIRQRMTVPAGINKLSVGYRVLVDKDGGVADSQEKLIVEILNNGGGVVQTLNTIPATQDTTDPFYRNYRQFNHDLPAYDYAGKTYWLRFRSVNAYDGRFRIDNVYAAYEGVPTADFTVTVDEADGSVTFQVTNISGIDPSMVSGVYIGGPAIKEFKLGSQGIHVRDTSEFTVNTSYSVTASIYNSIGEKVAEIGPKNFVVKPVTQIMVNPGFENGSAWWEYKGAVDFVKYQPEWGDGNAAYLGSRWVRLAGQGAVNKAMLRQWVFVPETAVSAQLTFRLRIDSSELLPNDHLRVRVLDAGYNFLAELQDVAGNAETDMAGNFNGHKKYGGFDLLGYKGKKIYIEFEAEEDAAVAATFILDNVRVTYTESR